MGEHTELEAQKRGISDRTKELMRRNFDDGKNMLSRDSMNSFQYAQKFAEVGQFDKIESIKTYEEYFRDSASRYAENEREAYYEDNILQSDSEAIIIFNARVAKFNADLDLIKEEKDAQAVKQFVADMMAIVNRKREVKS